MRILRGGRSAAMMAALGVAIAAPVRAPAATDKCEQIGWVFYMAQRLHYRLNGSSEEMAGYAQKAYEALLRLAFDKNIIETHPELLAFQPITIGPKGWTINCSFAPAVATAMKPPRTPEEVLQVYANLFLYSLDPHSSFLSGADAQAYTSQERGEMIGIGIVYRELGKAIVIGDVYENSPAAEAGIQVGSEILSVTSDGKRADGSKDGIDKFVEVMLGAEGGGVVLELRKPNGEKVTLNVTRKKFKIVLAKGKMLPDGNLHITVREFDRGVASEVGDIVTAHPEAKGIILDLRSNPGGIVGEAVAMVDLFVGWGPVVSMWGRRGRFIDVSFASENIDTVTDAPMVVLVNSQSASASEIVTQALSSDGFGRAMVVGESTWGKGSVMGVRCPAKDRCLVLTESVYYTTGGKSFHGFGEAPDVAVPDPILAQMKAEARARKEKFLEHEAEFATALPKPKDLTLAQRQRIGIVEPNPVREILKGLPEAATMSPAGVSDPALEVSDQVLAAWSSRCGSYRVEDCGSGGTVRVGSLQ